MQPCHGPLIFTIFVRGYSSLRLFGASSQILSLFYTFVVQTMMLYCSTAWFNSLSIAYKNKLFSQIKICAKITGRPVETVLHSFKDAQNMN